MNDKIDINNNNIYKYDEDEVKKIKKEGKNTGLLTLTAIFSVLTFSASAITMVHELGVGPFGFGTIDIEDESIPTEVMKTKAEQLSEIFKTKFVADEYGYVSADFSNEEGSIKLQFEIDDEGNVTYCYMDLLNMNGNKELNDKAKSYIISALQLSDHSQEALKELSDYVERISNDDFLKTEEYKEGLKEQLFYHYVERDDESFYVDFSTLDPHNPERYLQLCISY